MKRESLQAIQKRWMKRAADAFISKGWLVDVGDLIVAVRPDGSHGVAVDVRMDWTRKRRTHTALPAFAAMPRWTTRTLWMPRDEDDLTLLTRLHEGRESLRRLAPTTTET